MIASRPSQRDICVEGGEFVPPNRRRWRRKDAKRDTRGRCALRTGKVNDRSSAIRALGRSQPFASRPFPAPTLRVAFGRIPDLPEGLNGRAEFVPEPEVPNAPSEGLSQPKKGGAGPVRVLKAGATSLPDSCIRESATDVGTLSDDRINGPQLASPGPPIGGRRRALDAHDDPWRSPRSA
jgi:hypothetical protein